MGDRTSRAEWCSRGYLRNNFELWNTRLENGRLGDTLQDGATSRIWYRFIQELYLIYSICIHSLNYRSASMFLM